MIYRALINFLTSVWLGPVILIIDSWFSGIFFDSISHSLSFNLVSLSRISLPVVLISAAVTGAMLVNKWI